MRTGGTGGKTVRQPRGAGTSLAEGPEAAAAGLPSGAGEGEGATRGRGRAEAGTPATRNFTPPSINHWILSASCFFFSLLFSPRHSSI